MNDTKTEILKLLCNHKLVRIESILRITKSKRWKGYERKSRKSICLKKN